VPPSPGPPSPDSPTKGIRRFWHDLRRPGPEKNLRRLVVYAAIGLAAFFLLFAVLRHLPTEALIEELRGWGIVPFFIGFTLLPLVGFPTTPFYLVAGATFGTLASIIGASVGLAVQFAIAYWLASRFLRNWIGWLVRRAGYSIPEVKPAHHLRVTLIVKVTPGPPTFLKSYILGLAKIPFSTFFVVSWTFSTAYALSFILLGESLIEGDLRQGLLGLLILAATVGVVFLLRKRLPKKN
jgi:uncharacterized membrane protein YdjX (TVP38/TMEM64 family)